MVVLGPCLNRMSSLSNVDLPTLAGAAINTKYFHSEVIFVGNWQCS
jgi:hypothetical protein